MGSPKISVGMPVYNGERYVESAIRAVLGQTFGDLELIISDNASTDGTREICERLAAEDARIRFLPSETNVGAARNYNRTFEHATGEYFRWANADDLSGPTLHETCLATLENRPDAVLAYGNTILIDPEGAELGLHPDDLDIQDERPSDRYMEFFRRASLTNAIYGLMRRDALARTSLFQDVAAGDVQMMAELLLQGKFVEIPTALFYRRMHPGAFSAVEGQTEEQKLERQRQFWNPAKSRFAWPVWRKLFANARSVSGARIGVREKARLYAYLARRMYWARRELFGEFVTEIGRGFGRPG